MKKNAIAFCFDKNYAKYCQVAIFSLLINNGSCFNIYCFHTDDVDPVDLANIKKIGFQFCLDINIVKIDINVLKKFKINSHFSHANYIRILLQDLLPEEDKVLYLDADIIVNKSIAAIFNIEMANYKYLGVFDHYGSLTSGLDAEFKEKYINSGVLMMNLRALREDDSFSKMASLYDKYHKKISWVDQCLINIYGKNSIYLIDDKFNYQVFSHYVCKDDWFKVSSEKSIFHFVGGYKPWHSASRIHISEFWWRYASLLQNDRLLKVKSILIDDLIIESKSLEEYDKFEESCKVKNIIISELINEVNKGKSIS